MSRKNYQDISFADFKKLKDQADSIVVDVRERWEFEEFNEGGVNIPLSEIRDKRSVLEPYHHVLVICTNGVRSRVAAMDYCRVPEWLDKNIYHVKGGILEME